MNTMRRARRRRFRSLAVAAVLVSTAALGAVGSARAGEAAITVTLSGNDLTVTSSKGISHFTWTLCGGTAGKEELTGDLRSLTRTFGGRIATVTAKAGTTYQPARQDCVPPDDVCPNIEGTQTTVPAGLVIDRHGHCVRPPDDLCPNIEGTQTTVPAGHVTDTNGHCVSPPRTTSDPPDACPNLEGVQSAVPAGMTKNGSGHCVTPDRPAPSVDLGIVKVGSPTRASVGRTVQYRLVVTNHGTEVAHDVVVDDRLPSGAAFVSVSTTAGTCSSGPAIRCRIASLAVGAQVVVRLVVRGTVAGAVLNVAHVSGREGDPRPENNTAAARVNFALFQPPPAPKCRSLSVTPRQLFAGRAATVTIRVWLHGDRRIRVRVRVEGAGVDLVRRTDQAGAVRVRVRPVTPGVLTVRVLGVTGCADRRLGSAGRSDPSLTG